MWGESDGSGSVGVPRPRSGNWAAEPGESRQSRQRALATRSRSTVRREIRLTERVIGKSLGENSDVETGDGPTMTQPYGSTNRPSYMMRQVGIAGVAVRVSSL